ncbi:MAG: PEP-CTERM sorting domain-containing protein [Colwellia sp.]|nr:PEP-CTERM sorting domain-containing protein [Colwellia sp.]
MLQTLNKTLLVLSLLITSSIASASLITNGSFEELVFADNSTSQGTVFKTDLQTFENKKRGWDVFYTLPGWITTAGNGIELQKNIVTKSADGNNHVELDSHPSSSSNTVMTQSLESLTIGAEYLLEFSYKARTNKLNDNGIKVFWHNTTTDFNLDMDTDEVFHINLTKQQTPNWAVQSMVLTAQSKTMDLSFGAFGKENSLGGLLDNVSLVQISNSRAVDVPEPSAFALLLLGIAILVRRQQNKSK